MAILTRPIPSTGERLPAIGLGTWQSFDIGTGRRERAACRAVLETLFAGGGSAIDSSPMYGRAEAAVGELLAGLPNRPKPFIATKVWTRGAAQGRAQMAASLAKLGSVDLMQIHNLVDWRTHWPLIQEWKAAGRIRYAGITHYTAGALDDLAAVIESTPVDFVQCAYSVVDRAPERRLLPLCADRGVAMLANRPLAEGAIPRRLRRRALPDWAGAIGCDDWAGLALKFILSHPAVTCAIPATRDAAHMAANLRAAAGPLPDADLRARIAALWA